MTKRDYYQARIVVQYWPRMRREVGIEKNWIDDVVFLIMQGERRGSISCAQRALG
jgi:hypothetical protein